MQQCVLSHMRSVIALSVVIAVLLPSSSTSASSSPGVDVFLSGGAHIEAELPVRTRGDFRIEDMSAIGKPEISCSGSSAGAIEPPGKVLVISKLVDSSGNVPLKCADQSGFCLGTAEFTPLHLPWYLDLDLRAIEPTTILIFLKTPGKAPAYSLACQTFLGLVEDMCEGQTTASLRNVAGGVIGTIGEEIGIETFECRLGPGGLQLLTKGSSLLVGTHGRPLSIS